MEIHRVGWGTRLAVKINSQTLFPVQSFGWTFDTPQNIIDTVDNANVGYENLNRRYKYVMSVHPLSVDNSKQAIAAVRFLNDMALRQKTFPMTYVKAETQEFEEAGKEIQWVYESVNLLSCRLEGGGIGQYDSSAGMRVQTYTGKSLGVLLDNTDQFT